MCPKSTVSRDAGMDVSHWLRFTGCLKLLVAAKIQSVHYGLALENVISRIQALEEANNSHELVGLALRHQRVQRV